MNRSLGGPARMRRRNGDQAAHVGDLTRPEPQGGLVELRGTQIPVHRAGGIQALGGEVHGLSGR